MRGQIALNIRNRDEKIDKLVIAYPYTAYEIGRELDNQWWFYGDEKNIFHTRAEAEQCLEYLKEVFKDNPLEKMPFRMAQAHMEEALGKFIALQGRGLRKWLITNPVS